MLVSVNSNDKDALLPVFKKKKKQIDQKTLVNIINFFLLGG